MNNRLKYIGIPIVIVMTPFLIAAIVLGFFVKYFSKAFYFGGELVEKFAEWLNAND